MKKEKEIQDIYRKYGKKALKDCKEMSIEEEKKYIKKEEIKMKKEIQKIEEKYSNIKKIMH